MPLMIFSPVAFVLQSYRIRQKYFFNRSTIAGENPGQNDRSKQLVDPHTVGVLLVCNGLKLNIKSPFGNRYNDRALLWAGTAHKLNNKLYGLLYNNRERFGCASEAIRMAFSKTTPPCTVSALCLIYLARHNAATFTRPFAMGGEEEIEGVPRSFWAAEPRIRTTLL
jgi:hypothetical protein